MQAKIKRILAEKDVQVRRMRSDQHTLLNRRVSFIVTTNAPRPLADHFQAGAVRGHRGWCLRPRPTEKAEE